MSQESTLKRQTRLQTKFLLGLGGILLLFTILASVTIYFYALKSLEREAYEKTELVMTAMAANRNYVRDVLRPKMYELLEDENFVLEAMSSSYVSRSVMERVNTTLKDFKYRRVAINARNPDYEASPLEARMIKQFQDDPTMEEWRGIVELGDERYYMRFKPEYFDKSCTYCHGDPQQAPQKILELYGDTRGFFRQPGEVSGLISVGLPVDLSLVKIKEYTIAVFMVTILMILFLYGIISVFFNRFIVQNLNSILDIFRSIPGVNPQAVNPQGDELDEIHQLTSTASLIADQLSENRFQLEQYNERLLQSKELLQSVFDGITDPVILLDRNARIRIVNAEFLRRYETSLEQVIGVTPAQLQVATCCPLQNCLDALTDPVDHPISREIRVASGEIFLVYFYPIQSTIGVVDNLVCYVKDITEEKRLEKRIQQTEKLVSIGQLAAGLAHEINNPLGVILCHLELLKDEEHLPAEAKADLSVIEKHANACRSIMADLLNFAHQQTSTKEKGSLNAIIMEVVGIVAGQFQKANIQINTRLEPHLPELLLDSDKIRQVLLNMLLNSSHAIDNDGEITVTTRRDGDGHGLEMIIEDTGSGIPEEIAQKIFDPFFTTKPPGKGTGLGLSVSYGIIKEHGGDIRVESRPGQTTRFIIHFPEYEA